jgi:hypothetical protein
MSYKIAIGSSDGVNVDLSFGSALEFYIYDVEGTEYKFLEKREYVMPEGAAPQRPAAGADGVNVSEGAADSKKDCGSGAGCGSGGSCGTGGGCGSGGGTFPKVQLVSDCRCVICLKVGFNVCKQFEKLAISSFDVDCTVKEALDKITGYFDKIDNHQSLRNSQKK